MNSSPIFMGPAAMLNKTFQNTKYCAAATSR
jgi:hypothetical protein